MIDRMAIIGEDFGEEEPAGVSDADRKAADELMVHIGGLLPRGNMLDVEAEIAEMFARHRLTAIEQGQGRVEAMREALERIDGMDDPDLAHAQLCQNDRPSGLAKGVRLCADIARAALTQGEHDVG